MSDEALRRRLSRLGKRRGKSPEGKLSKGTPRGAALPPGEDIDTPHGSAYRIETSYPLEYLHGTRSLSSLLGFETVLAAEVMRQPGLTDTSLKRMIFIDTETTGLAAGAGTIVFLIGVGAYKGDSFRLRQYFLRDLGEEQGLLHAMQADLEAADGFVSFNGRAFDLPLLEMRYRLSMRRKWSLTSLPQMDLMYPSRRLWRRSLPDCRLSTIEQHVLGVQRTEQDVPGNQIPGMYRDYLRSGDASDMARVVYHNAIDILSLVGLAAHVLERHSVSDPTELSGAEALAVARFHDDSDRPDPAESAYRAALDSSEKGVKLEALQHLSNQLKRQGRRDDAVELWHAWNKISPEDPKPRIELAMYYEWHVRDLTQARHWGQEALTCLTHWQDDWRRDELWTKIEHRLARLAKKLSRQE
jgi:uncharacterized protein YprB with RNaseH-like and TPR domain